MESSEGGSVVPGGRRSPQWRLLVVAGVALAVGVGIGALVIDGLDDDGDDSPAASPIDDTVDDSGMGMGDAGDDAPRLPPVAGLFDGEQILFVHTETSDAEIAATLTTMILLLYYTGIFFI